MRVTTSRQRREDSSTLALSTLVTLRRRKRAIVAFARQLLIDIWKWQTGRTTPQALGWKMS